MLGLLLILLLIAAVVSLAYNSTIGLMPGGLLGLLAVILVVWLLTRS